jgi:hypothetical protein
MVNDINAYIKEVFSKKLAMNFDNKGVHLQVTNKDYEGEIKQGGDTVHIRSLGDIPAKNYSGGVIYDDVVGGDDTLVIDQAIYFAFKASDIEKAQSDIEIFKNYEKRAAISVDLQKDTFIQSKVDDAHANNVITFGALTKNNIYSAFVQVREKLETANAVNTSGKRPWIIVNPYIKALLVQAPEFTQATSFGENVLRKGALGEIADLDVMLSTNLSSSGAGTYNIMAGTNDAITFASQIEIVETLRLQNSFETAVRGLYVYGAKTVNNEALVKLNCTIA